MGIRAGALLDDDLDPGAGQAAGHIGNERDAMLAGTRFGRDGEFHGGLSEHARCHDSI
jgi:hypothetical protein